jgi:RNA polymerase subunit RPABC4/transcription elongation factor Spt4
VYKPKAIPFTSKVPVPASPPKEFQSTYSEKSIESSPSQTPFRVMKREEPPKPQPASVTFEPSPEPQPKLTGRSPIFQTVKPTVSSSDSLIDYMSQTIITKKEKKKIAKEKKKQDKEKTEIKKEKKILESREKGSLFQTLTHKTEALTQIQDVPFMPFVEESKTKKGGISKLRIIPNVADIGADSSTFTEFTSIKPNQEEKPKPKSSDLLACEHCGTILSSDFAFCNKCGNKL